MTAATCDAGRRDCTCPRVRHAHGTRAAYNRDGCRGSACLAAHAAWQRRLHRRHAALAWQGKTMWTNPIGTVRRLQALAADGWPLPELAARLDIVPSAVSALRTRQQNRILTAKADRITALYEQLWHVTPPQTKGSSYAGNQAERRGWAQSWRWEGVNIDDPAASPLPLPSADIDEVKIRRAVAGEAVTLTRAERAALPQILEQRGMSATQIAKRLSTSPRTVQRHRAKGRAA
jgi:DNA-binding CsgD family transcriptional regulator